MKFRISGGLITGLLLVNSVHAANDLASVFKEADYGGAVRAYYNTRSFETKPNQSAFSLGGNLRLETSPLYGIQAGFGFYTANDVGLNSDNPENVIGVLPGKNVNILAESFLRLRIHDSMVTAGRQLVKTPFANPSDSFIIPVTFEAVSLNSRITQNLELTGHYLTQIKNRPAGNFVNVGRFATGRLGAPVENTNGTAIVGITWGKDPWNLQVWGYQFSELYNMGYVETGYSFWKGRRIQPFVGAQYVIQKDAGDSLLGKVNTNSYGIKLGASLSKFKITLAYNDVANDNAAFRNGALLAPYNFSTSALYTNNQISAVENIDSGNAYKVTLNYKFSEQFKFKLSHAGFDFNNAADRGESNIDFTYFFEGWLRGLSFRNRIAIITSSSDATELINTRSQLQFIF